MIIEKIPNKSFVNMLGKLYVRDDDSCVVGEQCYVNPKIPGTVTKDKTTIIDKSYLVLERSGQNVVKILFNQ